VGPKNNIDKFNTPYVLNSRNGRCIHSINHHSQNKKNRYRNLRSGFKLLGGGDWQKKKNERNERDEN